MPKNKYTLLCQGRKYLTIPAAKTIFGILLGYMRKKTVIPFVMGIFLAPMLVFASMNIAIKSSHSVVLGVEATPTIVVVSSTPTQIPTNTPTNTPTPNPTKKPTPTKLPTPTILVVSATQLDEWFTKYSQHFSIDRQKLWRMAVCESNLKSNATNGDYAGLYQFSTRTWISTRKAMNENTDPSLRFNPLEAIKTAAFKISTDGLNPWPNCNK